MPSLSESAPRAQLFAFVCVVLAACDPPLPSGAYEPEDIWAFADAEAGVAPKDAELSIPKDQVLPEASVSEQTPLLKLQSQLRGDYWMRVELSSVDQAGITRVNTKITSFHQARVAFEDGQLKLFDLQCTMKFDQDNRTTTTISRVEQEANENAKRVIELTPDLKSWRTAPASYALGYEPLDPNQEPPGRGGQGVVDPGGDGDGINVRVTNGDLIDCTLRVTQRVTFAFNGGTIAQGALERATVDATGTKQVVVDRGSCPSANGATSTPGERTVTFIKLSTPIASFKPCPSEAQFLEAFRGK